MYCYLKNNLTNLVRVKATLPKYGQIKKSKSAVEISSRNLVNMHYTQVGCILQVQGQESSSINLLQSYLLIRRLFVKVQMKRCNGSRFLPSFPHNKRLNSPQNGFLQKLGLCYSLNKPSEQTKTEILPFISYEESSLNWDGSLFLFFSCFYFFTIYMHLITQMSPVSV